MPNENPNSQENDSTDVYFSLGEQSRKERAQELARAVTAGVNQASAHLRAVAELKRLRSSKDPKEFVSSARAEDGTVLKSPSEVSEYALAATNQALQKFYEVEEAMREAATDYTADVVDVGDIPALAGAGEEQAAADEVPETQGGTAATDKGASDVNIAPSNPALQVAVPGKGSQASDGAGISPSIITPQAKDLKAKKRQLSRDIEHSARLIKEVQEQCLLFPLEKLQQDFRHIVQQLADAESSGSYIQLEEAYMKAQISFFYRNDVIELIEYISALEYSFAVLINQYKELSQGKDSAQAEIFFNSFLRRGKLTFLRDFRKLLDFTSEGEEEPPQDIAKREFAHSSLFQEIAPYFELVRRIKAAQQILPSKLIEKAKEPSGKLDILHARSLFLKKNLKGLTTLLNTLTIEYASLVNIGNFTVGENYRQFLKIAELLGEVAAQTKFERGYLNLLKDFEESFASDDSQDSPEKRELTTFLKDVGRAFHQLLTFKVKFEKLQISKVEELVEHTDDLVKYLDFDKVKNDLLSQLLGIRTNCKELEDKLQNIPRRDYYTLVEAKQAKERIELDLNLARRTYDEVADELTALKSLISFFKENHPHRGNIPALIATYESLKNWFDKEIPLPEKPTHIMAEAASLVVLTERIERRLTEEFIASTKTAFEALNTMDFIGSVERMLIFANAGPNDNFGAELFTDEIKDSAKKYLAAIEKFKVALESLQEVDQYPNYQAQTISPAVQRELLLQELDTACNKLSAITEGRADKIIKKPKPEQQTRFKSILERDRALIAFKKKLVTEGTSADPSVFIEADREFITSLHSELSLMHKGLLGMLSGQALGSNEYISIKSKINIFTGFLKASVCKDIFNLKTDLILTDEIKHIDLAVIAIERWVQVLRLAVIDGNWDLAQTIYEALSSPQIANHTQLNDSLPHASRAFLKETGVKLQLLREKKKVQEFIINNINSIPPLSSVEKLPHDAAQAYFNRKLFKQSARLPFEDGTIQLTVDIHKQLVRAFSPELAKINELVVDPGKHGEFVQEFNDHLWRLFSQLNLKEDVESGKETDTRKEYKKQSNRIVDIIVLSVNFAENDAVRKKLVSGWLKICEELEKKRNWEASRQIFFALHRAILKPYLTPESLSAEDKRILESDNLIKFSNPKMNKGELLIQHSELQSMSDSDMPILPPLGVFMTQFELYSIEKKTIETDLKTYRANLEKLDATSPEAEKIQAKIEAVKNKLALLEINKKLCSYSLGDNDIVVQKKGAKEILHECQQRAPQTLVEPGDVVAAISNPLFDIDTNNEEALFEYNAKASASRVKFESSSTFYNDGIINEIVSQANSRYAVMFQNRTLQNLVKDKRIILKPNAKLVDIEAVNACMYTIIKDSAFKKLLMTVAIGFSRQDAAAIQKENRHIARLNFLENRVLAGLLVERRLRTKWYTSIGRIFKEINMLAHKETAITPEILYAKLIKVGVKLTDEQLLLVTKEHQRLQECAILSGGQVNAQNRFDRWIETATKRVKTSSSLFKAGVALPVTPTASVIVAGANVELGGTAKTAFKDQRKEFLQDQETAHSPARSNKIGS